MAPSALDLPASDSASIAPPPRLHVLGQGAQLTEHDAGELVDRLETMLSTTASLSLLPRNLSLLASPSLTPAKAFKQIDNLKALGVARWPDTAGKLQLLQYRLHLAGNALSEAADVLWNAWQRPYRIRSADLLSRQVVAAATICLAAGDLAGVRRWLEWGDAYFRLRDADGWFRVVDWLVEYVPGELKSSAIRRRRGDHWNVNLRRLARWSKTAHFLPVPRFLREKGARFMHDVSRLAYRTRPGAGIQAAVWDAPLRPPVETLAAIRDGLHNGSPTPDDRRPEPENGQRPSESPGARSGILVTRAMGGIGDLLMMTAGLHTLAQRTPGERLHMAVPASYFPLFEGNPDIELLDINDAPIDLSRFSQWINLTDCPAGRVESATAPRVKQNRIDIFARAMGGDPKALLAMPRRPRYFLTAEDRQFQSEFWESHQLRGRVVVGLQLKSQESYKDYAGMMEIANQLAEQYQVLLFHSHDPRPDDPKCHARITSVFGYPLRQAFSLVAQCDVIVSPDSAFVHFAAAVDVPCVALFGPTDGKVFTRYYPRTVYLDCRDKLGCVPCWRNQYSTCHLSQGANSVCMQVLPLAEILQAVDAQIRGKNAAQAAPGV